MPAEGGFACSGPTTPDKNLAIGARSYDSTVTAYFGGESGPGSMAKSIFVPTNDRQKRRVKLTVMAKVVQQVKVVPKKLRLSWSEENTGMPDIQTLLQRRYAPGPTARPTSSRLRPWMRASDKEKSPVLLKNEWEAPDLILIVGFHIEL